jgi:hypothetical protein
MSATFLLYRQWFKKKSTFSENTSSLIGFSGFWLPPSGAWLYRQRKNRAELRQILS